MNRDEKQLGEALATQQKTGGGRGEETLRNRLMTFTTIMVDFDISHGVGPCAMARVHHGRPTLSATGKGRVRKQNTRLTNTRGVGRRCLDGMQDLHIL